MSFEPKKGTLRAFWDWFVLFSGISTASNLSRTRRDPVQRRGLFLFRKSKRIPDPYSSPIAILLASLVPTPYCLSLCPLSPVPICPCKLDHMSLTRQQALDYFHSPDLIGLGFEADAVRRRLHPEGVVTYIIDRNINYTNFCTEYCTFCAFYRPLPKEGKKSPAPTRATSSRSRRSTRRSPKPRRWAAPAS